MVKLCKVMVDFEDLSESNLLDNSSSLAAKGWEVLKCLMWVLCFASCDTEALLITMQALQGMTRKNQKENIEKKMKRTFGESWTLNSYQEDNGFLSQHFKQFHPYMYMFWLIPSCFTCRQSIWNIGLYVTPLETDGLGASWMLLLLVMLLWACNLTCLHFGFHIYKMIINWKISFSNFSAWNHSINVHSNHSINVKSNTHVKSHFNYLISHWR